MTIHNLGTPHGFAKIMQNQSRWMKHITQNHFTAVPKTTPQAVSRGIECARICKSIDQLMCMCLLVDRWGWSWVCSIVVVSISHHIECVNKEPRRSAGFLKQNNYTISNSHICEARLESKGVSITYTFDIYCLTHSLSLFCINCRSIVLDTCVVYTDGFMSAYNELAVINSIKCIITRVAVFFCSMHRNEGCQQL